MCIFVCESPARAEKALYYVSMQLLVDRKLKKVMLKFLIYPSRTFSDEVIFGVENLKFLKSCRKLPEPFQEASRRCRVPSLRVLRPETRLTVYRAIAVGSALIGDNNNKKMGHIFL